MLANTNLLLAILRTTGLITDYDCAIILLNQIILRPIELLSRVRSKDEDALANPQTDYLHAIYPLNASDKPHL
jgi:hypothetical protein